MNINNIIKKIFEKMIEYEISQRKLAEMTGIHRAMISRLEALDYIPSIDQLQAIAEALGFEVTDLFEEENYQKNSLLSSLLLYLFHI